MTKQLQSGVVTVMQGEWGGPICPVPLAVTPGPLLFLISTLSFPSAGLLFHGEPRAGSDRQERTLPGTCPASGSHVSGCLPACRAGAPSVSSHCYPKISQPENELFLHPQGLTLMPSAPILFNSPSLLLISTDVSSWQ